MKTGDQTGIIVNLHGSPLVTNTPCPDMVVQTLGGNERLAGLVRHRRRQGVVAAAAAPVTKGVAVAILAAALAMNGQSRFLGLWGRNYV